MQATPRRIATFAAAMSALCICSAGLSATTRPLYVRLGGEPVMTAVISETIDRVVADPRLNQSFKGSNIARIKRLIVEQICDLAGGGCHYSGDSMHEVHANHHITQREFFGLVAILRQSLRRHHVPLRERNELLALLAPMAPDVIEVRIPPIPKQSPP
ncbi:MAG TPA: group 1 truncated hemoglobin [Steroidobacteraceae bacterium]|jgi:hemoglobin|nr:group 1 truncated hemoglobin [Steroidobacteraceae bacterium]